MTTTKTRRACAVRPPLLLIVVMVVLAAWFLPVLVVWCWCGVSILWHDVVTVNVMHRLHKRARSPNAPFESIEPSRSVAVLCASTLHRPINRPDQSIGWLGDPMAL